MPPCWFVSIFFLWLDHFSSFFSLGLWLVVSPSSSFNGREEDRPSCVAHIQRRRRSLGNVALSRGPIRKVEEEEFESGLTNNWNTRHRPMSYLFPWTLVCAAAQFGFLKKVKEAVVAATAPDPPMSSRETSKSYTQEGGHWLGRKSWKRLSTAFTSTFHQRSKVSWNETTGNLSPFLPFSPCIPEISFFLSFCLRLITTAAAVSEGGAWACFWHSCRNTIPFFYFIFSFPSFLLLVRMNK